MTTQNTTRPSDEIERDLLAIFGDDSTPAPSVAQCHEMELSQLESLLAGENQNDVHSDEEFEDAALEELSDGDDYDNGLEDSSSDEEAEEPVQRGIGPTTGGEHWTLHRPATANTPTFTGQEEVKVPEEAVTPYDYFLQLFTPEIIDGILTSTNAYAVTLMAESRFRKARINAWKPITAAEFLIFLGILFQMGTIKLNRYTDYWRQHRLFNLFAKNYMARNRFLIIFRCLRFGPNNLESLIEYFNKKMLDIYSPGENISIDESMILSRGRSGIRQYIQGKRHKYGIKLYVLATPGGISLQIHMYKGSRDDEVGGKGHTDKVVAKLAKEFMNTGRHIFMDNYYNSVGLAKFLLRNGTNVTGTLRARRKDNPSVVCASKLGKGGSIFRYNAEGICICKWRDKRDVLTISTKLSPELIPFINRRGQSILKPQIVIEYNKYMSGVDRQDQMLSYYTCEHKTMRWYKKVGIHIFQMMMLNAYFLYNLKNNRTSLYDFRESVITTLLPPPRPLAVRNGNGQNENNIHVPAHLPKADGGRTKRKRCKHCWDTQKIRKNTLYECAKCPTSPGLCLECFGQYHNY